MFVFEVFLVEFGSVADEVVSPGPGVEVEVEGDLVLKGIREENVGKYTCVRENEAGQAEGSAWLQVLGNHFVYLISFQNFLVLAVKN